MDQLSLLVVLALSASLALAGARGVLGLVLQLMMHGVQPAPAKRDH